MNNSNIFKVVMLMAEKARFRKELIGFKKNDVYDFIEGLYKNFDEQLKKKDEEVENINRESNRLKRDIESMQDKLNGVEDYKSSIADVLLKAKQQGEEIIREAVEQGEEKRKDIAKLADDEKQRLDTFREELKLLMQGTVDVLHKYQRELERLSQNVEEVK